MVENDIRWFLSIGYNNSAGLQPSVDEFAGKN